MATSPSYSLPIGGLVGKTFAIYLRNLLPFSLLSAVVMAPWIVLLVSLRGTTDTALLTVAGLLQTLLAWVLTGAVTYGVVQQLNDAPAGFGDLLAAGLRSILRVLATSIVTGLIIAVGMLLLLVPGVIATVILYVAVPAAVIEGRGVGEAMNRSAALTKGSRWQIFGAALLIGLIMIGVSLLGAFVFAATAAEGPPIWFEIAVAIVLTPFGAVMAATCYVMLRQGKENVDVKQLAAVFD